MTEGRKAQGCEEEKTEREEERRGGKGGIAVQGTEL